MYIYIHLYINIDYRPTNNERVLTQREALTAAVQPGITQKLWDVYSKTSHRKEWYNRQHPSFKHSMAYESWPLRTNTNHTFSALKLNRVAVFHWTKPNPGFFSHKSPLYIGVGGGEIRTGDLRTSGLRTSDLRTSGLRTGDLRTSGLRTGDMYPKLSQWIKI
jgi:hypothetical protein